MTCKMKCAPLENLDQYKCVLIVTDHSDYDYERIVQDLRVNSGHWQKLRADGKPESRSLLNCRYLTIGLNGRD